jgi:hypothetical protein
MLPQQPRSLASRRLKFQLIFTTIVVLVALLLSWLIMGDSSPFHDYFLWHVGLPNLWAMTMFVPYLIGAMIEGNPHSPSELIIGLALIIQWFVLGWLLSIPISKLWLRRKL